MELEVAEGRRVLEAFGRYSAGVLGYPVDFTGPLTAYEIAELGAGLVSFPPTKRRRTSLPLPPTGTESEEDEAAVLDRTPMRGLLHGPKTAAPVVVAGPLAVRPSPPKRAIHPSEQLAAEMPPIGWQCGPIAILDTPTETNAPIKPDPPDVDSDEEAYYVSRLEQESPEYRAWAARMLETATREYSVAGLLREVEAPLVQVAERYSVQNVGSARVFTSTVRANAARKAETRREIKEGGLSTNHFRALGATALPPAERKPAWDITNLSNYALPTPQWPAGTGRYAVFQHCDLNPPRRCLSHDATTFTAVLPPTAATEEDKRALKICRHRLPVEFPIARANNEAEHPGLAPVNGFELWADSPAGRSITAVTPAPCTDFLVTASGRVIGPIDCTVILGQVIPKTENLNDGDLRRAAEIAYHNAIVDVFFPDPYAPPVKPTLGALLAPWAPLKRILPRTRCMSVILAISARDCTKRYVVESYRGPPTLKPLSPLQRMALQAVTDYSGAPQGTGYSRPSDPRGFGTAVHNYIKGAAYLQVGGMAAASSISISPLTLPIKAPVAEAEKPGDLVPRKRDGDGRELTRFPKTKTKREVELNKLQGTQNDQRTFSRAKRIELAKAALASGRLTNEETRKVRVALVKLEANRPQSNVERWTLINIISPRSKTNQGTVRESGLKHALNRSQWYIAAVFRSLTFGRDGTEVEYPSDTRPVEAGHRIDFCEWTSDPSYVRHVRLHIRWQNAGDVLLHSGADTGWHCALTPEERVVVIWAVYYRLSILVKRRVRAEMQAEFWRRDVSGCVKMLDEQIEAFRQQLSALSGLSSAFLRALLR